MRIYIKMVKNKNKKPPARINFEKKKDDKLRLFFKSPKGSLNNYKRLCKTVRSKTDSAPIPTDK